MDGFTACPERATPPQAAREASKPIRLARSQAQTCEQQKRHPRPQAAHPPKSAIFTRPPSNPTRGPSPPWHIKKRRIGSSPKP